MKNNLKLSASAIGFAITVAGNSHAITTITFEEASVGMTAMVNSPGAAVPLTGQLSTQYLSSNGVSFSSLAGYAALVDHGSGNPTASNPNIIGGTTSGGALSYVAPITISFFDAANTSVKAATNFFKIQGDWYPLGGSVFATAYDFTGNVLGSTSDTDNKIFGVSGPVLQFNNIAGIHSVVISGDSGTVGFDNLEYGVLTAAVPEPETYAMLLAGLGFLGLASHRRKQREVAA